MYGVWRAEQGGTGVHHIPDEAALAVALPNVVTMDLRFSSVRHTLYKMPHELYMHS